MDIVLLQKLSQMNFSVSFDEIEIKLVTCDDFKCKRARNKFIMSYSSDCLDTLCSGHLGCIDFPGCIYVYK